MIEISRHIEILLQKHDCVIVPNFGAFIVQHIAARYDGVSHRYFPPEQKVVFNPELKHNDGLLASSVAKKNKISFNEANEVVTANVKLIWSILNRENEISFGQIGSIALSPKNALVFNPIFSKILFPQQIGWKSINILPIDELNNNDRFNLQSPANKQRFKQFSAGLKWVACIIVAFVFGLILSTPIISDESNVVLASLSSLPESTNEVQQISSEPGAEISFPQIELFIADAPIEDIVPSNESVVRFNDSDNYALVVASLASHQQAEKFISEIKYDGKLEILENGGRFRVIAATGSTQAEALQATQNKEFSGIFPNCWPCRK